LRKFALISSAFSVLLFATCTYAQQTDIAVGGSTLFSSSPPIGVVNFQPPAEDGGTYVGASFNTVRFKYHLGIQAETAWRYHVAKYDGYETYRPIFTDVNALYRRHARNRIDLDFLAGVGIASTRFNLPATCGIPGCVDFTSSNHFMEDLGVGLRYRAWRRFFVRPELHYYHIENNQAFHSDSVFRAEVSVGRTWGAK